MFHLFHHYSSTTPGSSSAACHPFHLSLCLSLRLTNKALFRIFFPLLFTSGCSPIPPSPLRMSQKSISTHPHILHPHPSPAVNNSSFAKNPIEHQPTIIIHLHLHCNPHRHVTTTFAVRHHHHHDPGIYTHKYSLPPSLLCSDGAILLNIVHSVHRQRISLFCKNSLRKNWTSIYYANQ